MLLWFLLVLLLLVALMLLIDFVGQQFQVGSPATKKLIKKLKTKKTKLKKTLKMKKKLLKIQAKKQQ